MTSYLLVTLRGLDLDMGDSVPSLSCFAPSLFECILSYPSALSISFPVLELLCLYEWTPSDPSALSFRTVTDGEIRTVLHCSGGLTEAGTSLTHSQGMNDELWW